MALTKESITTGNDKRYVTIEVNTRSEKNKIERTMKVRSVAYNGLFEQPASEIKFVDLNLHKKRWFYVFSSDSFMMCGKKGDCIVIRFVDFTFPGNNNGIILFERKFADGRNNCNFFVESSYLEYRRILEFLKQSRDRTIL